MRQKKNTGFLFLAPSLLGVAIFYVIPYLDVIRRSFLGAVDGAFVGIKNYQTVIGNTAFRLAAANTLKFTLVCMPILIFLSLFVAAVLSKGRYGNFLKSCFLMPMALPAVSVALLWRLLFDKQGILNFWLSIFGGAGQDWMNTDRAFYILVFSYIWKNLGYDVVLWMAGLSGIPKSIYEAARVDGADEWKCFTKITLPNLKPALYTISVLSFLNSFKVFREAYLVAGNYPHDSIYLLQHLFNNWFRDLSLDKMAASAVLVSGVIIVLILLLERMWEDRE